MCLVVSETTPNAVVPKSYCMLFSQEIFKKHLDVASNLNIWISFTWDVIWTLGLVKSPQVIVMCS